MTWDELTVGISVSEPSQDDLEARGLDELHVRHAFVEVARQILSAGGSLAYGGDLRAGGYTMSLLALLRTYSLPFRPARDRIRQYLAYPVWQAMSTAEAADLAVYLTRVDVGPAPGGGTAGSAARARDLSAMRELMTRDTDARILLGGRSFGQSGRWPGVVEEAFHAVRAGQPMLVAGGFGGAAAAVASAVRGDWPVELTTEFQQARNPRYAELLDGEVGPTEVELRDTLTNAALHNGLSDPENRQLFDTVDLDLMMALILRGLASLTSKGTGEATRL